jgi:hypothetical protein
MPAYSFASQYLKHKPSQLRVVISYQYIRDIFLFTPASDKRGLAIAEVVYFGLTHLKRTP